MNDKFGSKKINPGTGRLVNSGPSKGSKQHLLPHKDAVEQLTKGNPWQRSMGNYAKLTPSGRNAPMNYQDIIDMGTLGMKVR